MKLPTKNNEEVKRKFLSDREQELLNQIVNDKYSVGAFSGMIFNAYVEGKGSVKQLTKHALNTRIILELLAEGKE